MSERQDLLAMHVQAIMQILGLDLQDTALCKTPTRVADFYLNFLFDGLKNDQPPCIQAYLEPATHHEKVLLRDIPFVSVCAHHLVPITGKISICYIPKELLIGFSKFYDLVHYYSRRPQLQESLTRQLADAIIDLLKTPDVYVHIKATHSCMLAQNSSSSIVETTAASGCFAAYSPLAVSNLST
ncbi:MAG: GTP cyclohydrolase I [Verrucomicrobia bacterium]|nr:GTP cyclohydrolase I [Verrucomicrobiota bacterium]MBS0645047.1 GTP cyclohydrolase I [Verrucomicrobiota bacterium]